MYKVSKAYTDKIYSGGAKHRAIVKFNGVALEDAERLIEKITITRNIISNGTERFSLDNFISTNVEMILHKVDINTIKDPVSISIGTLVGDNTYEDVPIGIFNIDGQPTTDKDKITLQLRDNAIKFDFNYNAQPLIQNNNDKATLKQILNDICSQAGVETDITSFNGEKLDFGIFDNTITARQYVSYIAEQSGKMATINREGKLTFVDLDSDEAKTIEGETITFNSELERNMSITVEGRTTQQTYTGKNLLKLKKQSSFTKDGLMYDVLDDGSLKITGTATAATQTIVLLEKSATISNGTYTYSVKSVGSVPSCSTRLLKNGTLSSDDSFEKTWKALSSNNTIQITSTITDEESYNYVFFYSNANITVNAILYFQLEKNQNATNYEPYVGGQSSPNPDYPQKINNVRGIENLLKNTNVNSGDGNYWSDYSTFDEKTRTLTRSTTSTNESFISHMINNLKSNTTYTLNLEAKSNGYVKSMDLYCYNDKTQGIRNSENNYLTTNFEEFSFTFTTDKNIDYSKSKIRIDNNGSTIDGKEAILTIKNVILVEGSYVNDYVPYGSNYLQLKNRGKSLIYYNNSTLRMSTNPLNGVSISVDDDGIITLNGTSTDSVSFCISKRMIDLLKSNKKYSFYVENLNGAQSNQVSLILYGNDGSKAYNLSQIISTMSGKNVRNITSNQDYKYTYFWFYCIKGVTFNNLKIRLMLVEGDYTIDTIGEYEPYAQWQTLNIDLKGNELCSDKEQTLKDELIIENGRAKIIKKIGEVALDGTEDFGKTTEGFVLVTNDWGNKNQSATLSNYFTTYTNYSKFKEAKEGAGFLYANVNNFYIKIDGATTVNEFRAKLKSLYNAGTPVKVQYELAESQTIDLGEVEDFITYKGQNNISNSDNANMVIKYASKREPFEIPINIVESFEQDETYEIDRVEYEDALRKFEKGQEGDYLYLNSANPYITNQTQIDQIYELLHGYSIDTFKTGKVLGNPALDSYDLIKFKYNNKEYTTLAQSTLTFNGVMIQNFETKIGTEARQSNVTINSQESKFKRAFTEIDSVNAQVKITTEQTQTIQDNLTNNYYTIEQANTLIQNAESGVTNTFSEAGGNNIFRNTGLWFTQSDSNNPYEFWTGKVEKQSTEKSSNMSLMLIKKGTLEQEQQVSNGNYTVSFKYKKLIKLSTCKVIINDDEYELTETTDTEWQTGTKDSDGNIITKPLIVNSNHINVKFTSTVENAIEIYDLMVNAGTVKLAYSQNENEVTTDTVNISKGITITSSANDTKFKANADGIRIVDKNNENTILTKFTDKGMTTKQIEVENEATIVKVLIQNVGNQTWFTRI